MFEDKIASKEVKDSRLAICNTCEHNKLGMCKKCGCVLHLKTQWTTTKCPVGKWGPVKSS